MGIKNNKNDKMPDILAIKQQMKWLKFEAEEIIEKAEKEKRLLLPNEACRIKIFENVYDTLKYFYSFCSKKKESVINFENENLVSLIRETEEANMELVNNQAIRDDKIIKQKQKIKKLNEEIKELNNRCRGCKHINKKIELNIQNKLMRDLNDCRKALELACEDVCANKYEVSPLFDSYLKEAKGIRNG